MTDDAMERWGKRAADALAEWFESADLELQERIRTLGQTDRDRAVALMLEMASDVRARAKADFEERALPELADEVWDESIRNGEIVPVLDENGNHKLGKTGEPLYRNAKA